MSLSYHQSLVLTMLLLASSILSSFSSSAHSQRRHGPKPAWRTPKDNRRRRQRRSLQERSWPVNMTVRTPAEYEPVASVALSAVYFRDTVLDIVAALTNHTPEVEVFLVNGQDSPLQFLPSDSVWMRDYGPVGVLLTDSETMVESMGVLDNLYYPERTEDGAFPCSLTDLYSDWTCYQLGVYFEGGNFMTDGKGNFFMSTVTYDWEEYADMTREEVDDIIKVTFGVETVHALEYAMSPEGERYFTDTGHIDMFAKLLGPCIVMVSETDAPGFKNHTDAAAEYFSNLECNVDGQTYEVFRTPAWTRIDEFGDTIWYTYANSLIVNDLIIIPGYSEETGGRDAEAFAVYQAACPSCVIEQVNTDDFILLSGSVHCMTRQLPVSSNSPSLVGATNVTCADIVNPACPLESVNNICKEQYPNLQFAVTQDICDWNTLYFETICCDSLEDRVMVTPGPFSEDDNAQDVEVWIYLDDKPGEIVWLILDANRNTVASSPIFDSNTTLSFDGYAISEFMLVPGMYEFVVLDAGGDGVDLEDIGGFFVDNISTDEIGLAAIFDLDIYRVDLFEITPASEPERPCGNLCSVVDLLVEYMQIFIDLLNISE